MSDGKPYDVGWGRPPKHTRWQKGESGNKSGRRKRPPSMKSIIENELDKKVVVKQGDKLSSFTGLEVVVKSLVAQASKGNASAIKMFFRLVERHGLDIEIPEPTFEMDYNDRKALHHALGRWLERVESGGKREWLTEGEMTDALHELDSDIIQMMLPFAELPAQPDPPRAAAPPAPVTPVPKPRNPLDDDLFF